MRLGTLLHWYSLRNLFERKLKMEVILDLNALIRKLLRY